MDHYCTNICGGDWPTVTLTNDDGIGAPGLRALACVLVSSDRFHVLVCAPDSVKSAVSHSITWQNVSLSSESASGNQWNYCFCSFWILSGTPANCTSLGVSKALFPQFPIWYLLFSDGNWHLSLLANDSSINLNRLLISTKKGRYDVLVYHCALHFLDNMDGAQLQNFQRKRRVVGGTMGED